MTKEQLAKLRAICDAASKGPWVVNKKCSTDGGIPLAERSIGCPGRGRVLLIADNAGEGERGKQADADAAFTATARDAMPDLLDELDRLRLEAEQWSLGAERRKLEAEQWEGAYHKAIKRLSPSAIAPDSSLPARRRRGVDP